jgi:hypothetical protein
MKSRKRILVHVLKPLWELAELLEKIPSSMPNDMKARLKFGAAEAAIFIACASTYFYIQLGGLSWVQFVIIGYGGLLAGSALPVMGVAKGLAHADRLAVLNARAWKQQMLKGAETKSLPA